MPESSLDLTVVSSYHYWVLEPLVIGKPNTINYPLPSAIAKVVPGLHLAAIHGSELVKYEMAIFVHI